MKDSHPEITTFQDLKCWQEARRLFLDLAELVGSAEQTSPASDILVKKILRIAERQSENIAASFSVTEPSGFTRSLKKVLKKTRRLESILYSAEDTGLISPEIAGELRKRTQGVSQAVKEHIRYLTNLKIKRMYREMENL